MSGTAQVLSPAEFAVAFGLVAAPAAPVPTPPVAIYTTGYNERWDTIAWKLYGDPTQINELVMANPVVPISCQLPPGTVLQAPLLLPPAPPAATTPWGPQ